MPQLKTGSRRNFSPLKPKLEDDVRERLEEPIVLRKIESVVENLKIGKSNGADGLGGEFYKALKDQIAPVLNGVFGEAYDLNS